MTTRAQLLDEMDAIEAVAKRLAQVAGRSDPQRKHDLAIARRELAMRMITIMTIGEDYPPIRQDPVLYGELRQRLSVLRAAIADHQTQWSAVAIDSDDAAYIASSNAVQAAGRDFMTWVRGVVERQAVASV
ncbi:MULTISPECIES: hypothetical protein [unclassified Sphingomonas]|uniref:hypothetical protein n=1 Tax=unclassified Sphingomonas TaxID=196159 RepID=UPI0026C68F34